MEIELMRASLFFSLTLFFLFLREIKNNGKPKKNQKKRKEKKNVK